MKTHTRLQAIGITLCVLSAVPVLIAAFADAPESVGVLAVVLLLFLVATAVYIFCASGARMNSYDLILQEGQYEPKERVKNGRLKLFNRFYWPIVTAIYLVWSFKTRQWQSTWIVWLVASLLYAAIASLFKKED